MIGYVSRLNFDLWSWESGFEVGINGEIRNQ